MKYSILLWIIAFVVTLVSASYQFLTGPSYPSKGKVTLGGNSFAYRLERSHAGSTDCPVAITTNDSAIHGVVEWRRNKTGESLNQTTMTYRDGVLSAGLPNQPPAGKLEYRLVLTRGNESCSLPEDGIVVVRFRGDVPPYVLIPHIFSMFVGMLFSARAGIGALRKAVDLRKIILWTILFLFFGGFILGPLVQWYAFGTFWSGWPVGSDPTDNKTAVALLAWLVAMVMLKRSPRSQRWALGAAIVTLLVYFIPHSIFGSELDYKKLDQKPISAVVRVEQLESLRM